MSLTRHRHLLPMLPLLAALPLFFVSWGQGLANPLRQLDDVAHLGYFAMLAWALTLLPPVARRPQPLRFGLPLAVVLVAGGAIELIQPRFGRTASWGDLGLDLLGGLLGLLFLAAGRGGLNRRLLIGSRLGILALAGLILAKPAATLCDMELAARQFPVLDDFESRLQAGRWTHGTIDHTLARHGQASLRVPLGTTLYSGTTLTRCFGDWRGYSAFALSIHNPGPGSLRLTISIRDQKDELHGCRYHDRFNRSFLLKPGWNDLRIPMAEIKKAPTHRNLDLAHLREVAIFATRLPAPRVIHLDDLRLIP